MAEISPIGLIDLKKMVEKSAHDWEHDLHLLNKLAALSGVKPVNLLRKICWSVGESTDMALVFMGQPLSVSVRARLQYLLNERMQVEYEIIDNCCHAFSQIVQLVPYAVGLAVISLLLFN